MSILDPILGRISDWTRPADWEPSFGVWPFPLTPDHTGSGLVEIAGLLFTGTPTTPEDTSYRVEIQSTGAPGAGTFRISRDGGATWIEENITIPEVTGYVVDGFVVYFPEASYDATDTFDWLIQGTTLGNGTLEGTWRKSGDGVDIRLTLVMGSTSSFDGANTLLPLPPGYARIDTSKIPKLYTIGPIAIWSITSTVMSDDISAVAPFFIYEWYGTQFVALPTSYLGEAFSPGSAGVVQLMGVPMIKVAS